jgi:hypothetical protein
MNQPLEIVSILSVLTERLTETVFTPIFERANLDKFWLKYIAWIIAGLLIYLSGANAFPEMFTNPVIGQIVTAVAGGGTANLIHDALKVAKPA